MYTYTLSLSLALSLSSLTLSLSLSHQAVQMLVSKMVNLHILAGVSTMEAHCETRDILLPPLYAFLRWSFASLHWKMDKVYTPLCVTSWHWKWMRYI
jgi:hypothetical protein